MMIRENAALLCQICASNGVPLYVAEDTLGLPRFSATGQLARDAFYAVDYLWSHEAFAEAESMIREGWSK